MHSYFVDTKLIRAEGFRPGEKGYPSAGRIAWALGRNVDEPSPPSRQVSRRSRRAIRSKLDSKVVREKAKDHNEKVGNAASKKTSVRTLAAVFRRGVGAYKTNPGSVRPSVTSADQWAHARVNSFFTACVTENLGAVNMTPICYRQDIQCRPRDARKAYMRSVLWMK